MLHPAIKVSQSPIAGRGLIVTEFIPAGTVLTIGPDENSGIRHSREAYEQLPPEVRDLCYQEGDEFVLLTDGSQYMNHSCDPTLIWQDDETCIASRDLSPGDEVTYDYATTETDSAHRGAWTCRCGAARCRGTITPNDCLDPAFQAQYPVLPSWTRAFIAAHQAGG